VVNAAMTDLRDYQIKAIEQIEVLSWVRSRMIAFAKAKAKEQAA